MINKLQAFQGNPENYEDKTINGPRRSDRLRAKITPRGVLIAWLSLINLAEGLMIKQLDSGVHLYNQESVSVKATDLVFNLQTHLNLTENRQIIDTAISRLDEECERNKINTDIHNYCHNLVNTLHNTKRLALAHIQGGYEKREKRAIGQLLMHGAKRYGVQIVGGALMAYGTYEILTDREENKRARAEIDLTAKTLRENTELLFNVQIGEQEEINEKINDIITQQRLKNLESSFVANFMAIDATVNQIIKAHDSILEIQPREEMAKFQERMAIALPQIKKLTPEDLLRRAKRVKILEDSRVVVKMVIPIEQDVEYIEWVLVNVPDKTNNVIHLDNAAIAYPLVIDKANSTMFEPTSRKEQLYENVDIISVPPCLKAVMKHQPLEDVCEKGIVKVDHPRTIEIREDHIILITGEDNATILCDKHARHLPKGQIYEIEYKNCSIHLKK